MTSFGTLKLVKIAINTGMQMIRPKLILGDDSLAITHIVYKIRNLKNNPKITTYIK
jgi:hypothetical protein